MKANRKEVKRDRSADRSLALGIQELENAANGDDTAWERADGWFGVAVWLQGWIDHSANRDG